ncbi:TRAM domain-containing protein, partial [Lactobacillus acetotolerans]
MRRNFRRNNHKEKDVIITIKRLGINGEGIGYYKKKIIFIPGALPDEVVVAKIIKDYPHYIQAELVRIKEKSPDRVAFPKDVPPEVGGLELAHL